MRERMGDDAIQSLKNIVLEIRMAGFKQLTFRQPYLRQVTESRWTAELNVCREVGDTDLTKWNNCQIQMCVPR